MLHYCYDIKIIKRKKKRCKKKKILERRKKSEIHVYLPRKLEKNILTKVVIDSNF